MSEEDNNTEDSQVEEEETENGKDDSGEDNSAEPDADDDQDADNAPEASPELKALVEAIIFASPEPVTIEKIKKTLRGEKKTNLKKVLEELVEEYNSPERGLRIFEVAGGYHIRTAPELSRWIGKLFDSKPHRLTQPSLETLAIIAYKQPITRPEVEEIRGVDCGGVVKTLLERNFVKIIGRRDVPGRPLLYGTTKEFLEFFNLDSLSSLPTLKDLAELTESTIDSGQDVLDFEGRDEENKEEVEASDEAVTTAEKLDSDEDDVVHDVGEENQEEDEQNDGEYDSDDTEESDDNEDEDDVEAEDDDSEEQEED